MKSDVILDEKILTQLKKKIQKAADIQGLTMEEIWKRFLLKKTNEEMDYLVVHIMVDILGEAFIRAQKIFWPKIHKTITPIDFIVSANRFHAMGAFLKFKLYELDDEHQHLHQLIAASKAINHLEMAWLLLQHAHEHYPTYFQLD